MPSLAAGPGRTTFSGCERWVRYLSVSVVMVPKCASALGSGSLLLSSRQTCRWSMLSVLVNRVWAGVRRSATTRSRAAVLVSLAVPASPGMQVIVDLVLTATKRAVNKLATRRSGGCLLLVTLIRTGVSNDRVSNLVLLRVKVVVATALSLSSRSESN